MISVLILAYNDRPSLPDLVERTAQALTAASEAFEIIVCDDASTDDTQAVIQKLQKKDFLCLRYVRHAENLGVGANFSQGFVAARGDVISYMDGDAQYDPADILPMLKRMRQEDAGAVSGIRERRADPFIRTLTSRVYNILLKMIYHIPVKDTNSGLKLYSRSFLNAALPLIATGPFYDAEILLKGYQDGFTILELPINHYPRKFGRAAGISRASLRSTFKSLIDERYADLRQRRPKSQVAIGLVSLIASLT